MDHMIPSDHVIGCDFKHLIRLDRLTLQDSSWSDSIKDETLWVF